MSQKKVEDEEDSPAGAKVLLYFHLHQPFRTSAGKNLDEVFKGINPAKGGGNAENMVIFEKVAKSCYIPITEFWIKVLENEPRFKIVLSITGTLLEQCLKSVENGGNGEKVLELLRKMVSLDNVEVLAESYYHGLSFFYNPQKHHQQIQQNSQIFKDLLGIEPVNFRNTELIFSQEIAKFAKEKGFKAMLADDQLENSVFGNLYDLSEQGVIENEFWKLIKQETDNWEYRNPSQKWLEVENSGGCKVLLKDDFLSRTVFFYNSDKMIEQTLNYLKKKKEGLVAQQFFGIYNDFEVIGEHNHTSEFSLNNIQKWVQSLIDNQIEFCTLREIEQKYEPEGTYNLEKEFEHLKKFSEKYFDQNMSRALEQSSVNGVSGQNLEIGLEKTLRNKAFIIKTRSEVQEFIQRNTKADRQNLACGKIMSSWANYPKDIRSWRGNEIQEQAMQELVMLEIKYQQFLEKSKIVLEQSKNEQKMVIEQRLEKIASCYGKLTTSDNFYYMADLSGQDGVQHQMFSPFNNQQEAFKTYLNAIQVFIEEINQFDMF